MAREAPDGPLGYVPDRRIVNAAFALLLGLVLALGCLPHDAAAKTKQLLVLGDSLTSGYGLANSAEAFPAQLQSALREKGLDVKVINGGVSGDTSRGGLERLDWSLADDPGYAIVALGANDGLRGIDPETTYQNLDAILSKLQKRGISVLLAGMYAPPNLGEDYGDEFKAVYPRLAKKHHVLLYPFFLEGVAADPALNQADGMHPNPKGVRVMVQHMIPKVMELLHQR